jgi:GGDEF domain-containing protein
MTASVLEVGVIQAVLATLAAVIMIGLGFLYRPNPATLLWSLMFLVVTVGSFGTIVAAATSATWVRDFSVGFMLGGPALVWAGLRADRSARSLAWVAAALCVAGAVSMLLTSGTPIHAATYSLVYLASTVMAALSAVELLIRPERGTGMLLPLTLISLVLPVIGLASVSASVLSLSLTPHSVLPDVKALGQVIYVTCALVSLLYLARFADAAVSVRGRAEFAFVAADRLARAEAAADRTWSMLSVSLDDTGPLRIATGEAGFRQIMERLSADVRRVFPVEADIGPDSPEALLLLISRPDAVIRDAIRELLHLFGTVTPDQPIAVELSASVGWASVRSHGYDPVTLIDAARAAMLEAREAGGSRWERARLPGQVAADDMSAGGATV